MKRVSLIISLAILISSCQSETNSENSSSAQEIKSDSVETILSVETNGIIANPRRIAFTSEGFALYDNGLHQIQLFTASGDHRISFGDEGRGPGEFQSVSAIKSYSDQIIVSDSERLLQYSFNHEGDLVSTLKLDANLFAMDNEVVSPSAFVSPTNGRRNSLATFIDKERDIKFDFGKPIVKTGIC